MTTTSTDYVERIDETTELTLDTLGPTWVEFVDLGIKALLMIAAFAIYSKL